jgi:hypothetical protein
MGIQVKGIESGKTMFEDGLKKPGKQLIFAVRNTKGAILGSINISRAESLDATTIELQTNKRSLLDMLMISGADELDLPLNKKTMNRTYEKTTINMQILPKPGFRFVDQSDQRSYVNLQVLLHP